MVLADIAAASLGPWPAGVRLRPIDASDLTSVAALLTTASRARFGPRVTRPEDLRIRWLQLADPREAVVVTSDDTGGMPVAYASTAVDHDPGDGTIDLHLDLHVHPAWTGQGLASALLSAAIDRGHTAVTADVCQLFLRTALVDGDERARRWLSRRGFSAVRHLLELRLDLHAPPPSARLPAGVTIEAYRPLRDDDALWQAHRAGFADAAMHLPIGRDDLLEDRFGAQRAHGSARAFLAWAGDDAIGLTICRDATHIAPEDGLITDLAVVPGWRRRGVAMALLRTSFAAFRDRGLTGAALAVDDVDLTGAAALYRAAGMRVTSHTEVMLRELPIRRTTGHHPA